MGNPHAVAFIDEPVESWPLERVGPLVERDPFFPRRVNFEIVNVREPGTAQGAGLGARSERDDGVRPAGPPPQPSRPRSRAWRASPSS